MFHTLWAVVSGYSRIATTPACRQNGLRMGCRLLVALNWHARAYSATARQGRCKPRWGGYQIASREAGIFIGGTFVAMQSHPFNGRNFICGRCGRGCYRIYDRDGWACRRCHRLSHPSRHKNRMLTGWHRLMFLRRKISASPVPFSAIRRARCDSAATGASCLKSARSKPVLHSMPVPTLPTCWTGANAAAADAEHCRLDARLNNYASSPRPLY